LCLPEAFLAKLPAGGWIASGHDFSRAAKCSKETPALAAEELQAMEKQDAGAIDSALKLKPCAPSISQVLSQNGWEA
jgi:hypothetical protein